ncbi:hypothetical protein OIU76_008434 [Salix suchowensis]|nr:hypothetical protein OIU76_008434 [Salix suchowensis]
MGALDEGHFNEELRNGVELDCLDLGFEDQPETVAIEDAVKVLLQGLGEDINREGLKKTPLRVAKALREGTKGYKQKAKDIVQSALFPEVGLDDAVGHAGGAGGLRVVGLSKLSRVADVFAKRLQDPQRLADEICSALHHGIKPAGVAIILQCSHMHFPNIESLFLDSSRQGWVKALVHSGSGVFENNFADVWDDFLSLLKFRGINVDKTRMKDSKQQCWCPSQYSSSVEVTGPPIPGMVTAVTSILSSLGEDPSREELVRTPSRFVKWLMNFQNANLEMKLNAFACGRTDPLKQNGEVSLHKQIYTVLNLSFWSQFDGTFLWFQAPSTGKTYQADCRDRIVLIRGGDVMVVVEANHNCMISRGIEKFGSSTATIAVLGLFSSDPAARAMFLQNIPTPASGGS